MRSYRLVFSTFFHFFVHARISAGLCAFSLIFDANDSVFRAEHAQLVRTSHFLSKARDLRVRKKVKKVENTKRELLTRISPTVYGYEYYACT